MLRKRQADNHTVIVLPKAKRFGSAEEISTGSPELSLERAVESITMLNLSAKLWTLWCLRKDAVIAVCYPVCYIVGFRDNKHFLPTRQIPYYVLPLESRMVSQNENKYRSEDKPESDSNHHL